MAEQTFEQYEVIMNNLVDKLFETPDDQHISITAEEKNIICSYFSELWSYYDEEMEQLKNELFGKGE